MHTGESALTPDQFLHRPRSQMVSRLDRLHLRLSIRLSLLELAPDKLRRRMVRLHNVIIDHLRRIIPKEGILPRRCINRHHDPEVPRLIIPNIHEDGRVWRALQVGWGGETCTPDTWPRLGRLHVVVEEAGDGGAAARNDGEGVAAHVLRVVAGADEVAERPGWVGADIEGGSCGCEADEA